MANSRARGIHLSVTREDQELLDRLPPDFNLSGLFRAVLHQVVEESCMLCGRPGTCPTCGEHLR